MKWSLLTLFCVVTVAISTGYSQNSKRGVGEFIAIGDSAGSFHPIEKVHLHLDKSYYVAGQTIWLRAYVVDGMNRPSMLSKIVYVDLIDYRGQVKTKLKLPLAGGLATGDIQLPDTLREGDYWLRAYTRWMQNYPEDEFYKREIRIDNPINNNVHVSAQYKYVPDTDGYRVNVLVNFRDDQGNPVTNTDITYQIKPKNQKRVEGMGRLDQAGNLPFSFIGNAKEAVQGEILFRLRYRDKDIFETLSFDVATGEFTVQFFPEGGELIDSLRSRVGFKALHSNGLGATISGYVLDARNARVAEFQTGHAGMGSFLLTPFTGQTYTAVINTGDGEEKRVQLPQSKPAGYIVNLMHEDNNKITVRVAASKTLVNNQRMSLVAMSNEEEVSIANFALDREFKDITILKKEFSTGVIALTLKEANIPLAERLLFINNDDQLELMIRTNKPEYKSRERVELKLSAVNNENVPLAGAFSLAVTDMTRLPVQDADDEPSIFSELLLKSELKGHIEQPNYYFTDTSRRKKDHLNDLLLTQGWRRLIYSKSPPDILYQPEKNIRISGSMLLRNNPYPSGRVTLFSPQLGLVLDTVTDSRGRFAFDNLVFSDTARFVIQGRQLKDRSNVLFQLDRIDEQVVEYIYPAGGKVKFEPDLDDVKNSREELLELIRQGKITRAKMLEEVVVRGTTNPNIVTNSSRLTPMPADYLIRADRLEGHTNLAYSLSSKVPGYMILKEAEGEITAGLLSNAKGAKTDAISPLRLFVDGVDWGTNLLQITVPDIAFVEILRYNHAIYGVRETGGVIAVTTRKFAGMPDYDYKPQGIVKETRVGYSVTRQFYSPDYSKSQDPQSYRDLRTTIYWNPEIYSENGIIDAIHFYTADNPGTYKAILEGIDHRGKLGRTVHLFTVK